MKAVIAAFNQEKALVGAFSVITNLRMELCEALVVVTVLLLLLARCKYKHWGRYSRGWPGSLDQVGLVWWIL